MELSTKAVVLIVVMVLVVIVLVSFFLFQSGSQISKADAKSIFEQKCIDYGKRSCPWDVTEEQGFDNFLQSCKVLYGSEREAFSCIYSLCGQCKGFEIENLECAARCSAIQGLQKKGGSDIPALCTEYKSDSRCGSVQCGVCGG